MPICDLPSGGDRYHSENPGVLINDSGTFLRGITSRGPNDIYVVGQATYNGGVGLGFVRHFNGTTHAAGRSLPRSPSASGCIAVGV